MAPKKKADLSSDDEFDGSDGEDVVKKAPKKKPRSPKKPASKPSTSAMTGDTAAAHDDDEGAGKHGYSGVYDHEGNSLLDVPIPPMAAPVMCADGSGARLMIKEIIVTNFKSYYGTQRIGPFHKNFSAIIGPNGSGKSNVIDSLLFVFGFRASRIRLKKLKELIHNSSGKKQPEYCSVEVVFQKIVDKEHGDFEVVPGSEFTVGRTAYQDSTSKYTINGKNRSKDEIEKKLKDVGIDLVHNRFLILQGEVEQIALMKPKAEAPGKEGMLEYLEDIIGSSRLKNFLNDINLKLEEIATQKSQQSQKVKTAEKERNALEGPVREMISHLRCENQATLISNKLLTMKKFKYEKELEKKRPQLEELTTELAEHALKLDEIINQRKEAEKEFAHLESDKETYQKKLGIAQKQIQDFEAKESRRKIDSKKCAKDLATAKNKMDSFERELDSLMRMPEMAEAQIEMFRGEKVELEDKVKSNEAKIEKNKALFDDKAGRLRDDKQHAEEALGEKQAVVNEIAGRKKIAQEELNLIVADETKVKNRLNELQKQLDDVNEDYTKKSEEHEAVRNRLPLCEKEHDEAREAAPQIQKELSKAKDELTVLRAKLADEQNAMSAQSHGSRVEQLLNEAQRRGEITTYFGRLGDLGAIDAKYDAAVTTTTTGLNNYVLQTKKDGDRALEIIKQAKIGRHNLLVLDAISEATNHMNAPRDKFLAPRVFDLLEIPDPRLKKAFYNVFRDTMIVEDMEKARHLFNKHKARYITFTGGCIDASGIISGGGKPRTGGIGTTVKVDTAKQSRDSAREIERLKADVDPKTRRVEELETKMRHNSQAIYKLSDELQQLRLKNRQLGTETQNLQSRITALEKQIAFQETQIGKHQVDQALVDDKREKLDEMSTELEAAEKDLAKAQEVFKKASDNLDRVWMELCGRFREAADQAAKDIEKIDQNIADHQGKLKSFDRDKVKAEARLETAQKTYEDKVKLQESLKRDEAVYDKEIGNLSEKRKEYEAKIQEVDASLKAARKATSQQDEEEGKLNRERERKSDELRQLKEHMKGVEHEMAKTQKEILGLKLHRIKDYGILPQKVRQVADYDHHIDHETLEEEKAHQKKMKKQKGKENGEDDSSGTEDNSDGDDGAVPALTEEDLADADRDDLKFKLTQLQEKVRKNKEHLNMRIIAEYAEKVKHYNQVNGVLQKLQENHAAHMKKQEEWKRVRAQEFMEGFSKIGASLKEMYQMITLGGDAALDLKNSLDPFDEGISFMVRPPKKSWKNMENLSGGEKTLSSLSLVFALHHFRPTPLYVMDEIDAALDFRNVSIIGHYVKDRTKNAQFIIISLRNNMFELGDRLVGIYKTDDCTKNVVVDPAMVNDGSSKFKVALATVHKMDLEKTLLNASQPTNDQEQLEDNAGSGASAVGGERGRKRASHDSNVPVFFDSKRPDQRLSPTSDPDRRPRRPLRTASQGDDSD